METIEKDIIILEEDKKLMISSDEPEKVPYIEEALGYCEKE